MTAAPMLTMTKPDQWESRAAVTQYLAYQLVHGRLALMLGAGVSMKFGLPKWAVLNEHLFAAVGETKPSGVDDLIAVEGLRLRHFDGNPKGFLELVQKALYASADLSFSSLSSNRVLMSVASLVMSSRRGSVSSVITTNYDDVLETFLNFFGFVTCSMFPDRFWNPSGDVAIYHPHGYLPSRVGERWSPEIVLDRESFSKVAGRPELPWYQTLSTILRTHTTIFIGTGGQDQNIDSLLVGNSAMHASVDQGIPYSGIVVNMNFEKNTAAVWKNRRIYPFTVLDYDSDLPAFLLGICQSAAELRRVPAS